MTDSDHTDDDQDGASAQTDAIDPATPTPSQETPAPQENDHKNDQSQQPEPPVAHMPAGSAAPAPAEPTPQMASQMAPEMVPAAQAPASPTAPTSALLPQQTYDQDTVSKAVNVLDAAATQQRSIIDAFLAQRRAVGEAVEAKKMEALSTLANARHSASQAEADQKLGDAKMASDYLASLVRSSLAPGSAHTPLDASPSHQAIPTTGGPTAGSNTVPSSPPAPSAASAASVATPATGPVITDEQLKLVSAMADLERRRRMAPLYSPTQQQEASQASQAIVGEIVEALGSLVAQEVQKQMTAFLNVKIAEIEASKAESSDDGDATGQD